MKKKIVDTILEVLKEHNELETVLILVELNKRNCKIVYGTLSGYLKQMITKGMLKRKAKGSELRYSWDNIKHWSYYYSLK